MISLEFRALRRTTTPSVLRGASRDETIYVKQNFFFKSSMVCTKSSRDELSNYMSQENVA